ncbi:MAG: family 1 glycosylhydrolase [Solirubrobacteraceae bacterium]|nr:family 1 glycosylhydrolase [Solirubrobacteraceae bacterium]
MRLIRPVLITLLALGAVLLGFAAPAAFARADQSMTFEAPRDLLIAEHRDAALAELDSLGVKSLRVILRWKDVAPDGDSATRPQFDATDPNAYGWGQYDALFAAAKARGWSVLVTLSSPVPKWATAAKRDTVTRPSAAEFRQFATAVGRKYGDQIDTWSVWNEPNLPDFLRPQISRGKAVGPSLYRDLYLAGRAGLHDAGQTGDSILFGETAPKGGANRLTPIGFIRGALCLDSKYRKRSSCAKVATEGVAHHAYTTRQGPSFVPKNAEDVTIRVVRRLSKALDRAARAGAISANLPLYLTEFGIQSTPDTLFGVSLLQQNEYRAISERMARENPRVVAFSQYLLRDDPPGENGSHPGFETGLRFDNGKAKPSLAGFRVPLAVRKRKDGQVSIWGLVRPAAGATTAKLQVSTGGSFRDLRDVTTDARGSFTVTSQGGSNRRWRLRWTTPGGKVYVGPATRAYDGV